MQKWEFRCHFGHRGELQNAEESLNQLGQQGWELIAAVPENGMGDSINVVFWLKRPL
jgi:hypothetical protein